MTQYNVPMDEEDVQSGPPTLTEAEIQEILAEYHRKQLIENLIGPGISLLVHMVILLLMFIFIVSKPPTKKEELLVQTKIMETVEIEKPLLEELQKEEITEDAPVTEPTDAPMQSQVDAASVVDVNDDMPQTNDNAETEAVLDIKVTNSVLTFSGPMGGRTDAGRKGLLARYGGSGRGQSALNRALKWLARVQNPNGSWGPGDGHPAHTGLALLTFLGHGETPASEVYGKTVEAAMRWLAEYAMDPQLLQKTKKRPMCYAHGIATYAICEAYAMTRIPVLRTPMENAVAAVIDGQMTHGGFGYGYTQGPRWDNSVSGWQVQALKSAYVAGSTNEKLPDALRKAIAFYRNVAKAKDGSRTGFGYAEENGGPAKGIRETLTGVGVVCLQLLGLGKVPEVNESIETVISQARLSKYKEVAENPAKWREVGGENLYGWYYDTQAVFNANAHGLFKGTWNEWNDVFQKVLIRAQNPEGYWETNGHHSIGTPDTPGRVLATCLAALQLEVYYRYLPTFDITKMDAAQLKDIESIQNVGTGGAVKVQ